MIMVSIGWLVGSMITGIIGFFFSFLIPINMFLSVIVSIIQLLFVYLFNGVRIFSIRFHKLNLSKISMEKSPSIYILLFFFSIISNIVLKSIYSGFPNSIPTDFVHTMDSESSLVSSILFGVNYNRNSFFLKDPLNQNNVSPISNVPMFFQALLMACGITYSESSVLICYMNIISTVCSLFYYSYYLSCSSLITTSMFLLNGSFVFLRLLKNDCGKGNDCIHNVNQNVSLPWYQIFISFICMNKSVSFSIPMSIFSVIISSFSYNVSKAMSYTMSGILLALIPTLSVSLATFLYISCISTAFYYLFPYGLSILPKLFYSQIHYNPLWKEQQMHGKMYSQINMWFKGFGIVFISLVSYIFVETSMISLHRFYIALSILIVFSVIRFGNDYYMNASAICAVSYPQFVSCLTNIIIHYVSIAKTQFKKGLIIGLSICIVVFEIIGGIASIIIILNNRSLLFNEFDFQCSEWIKHSTNIQDQFLSPPASFLPSCLFAGRQIIVGNPKSTWVYGSEVFHNLEFVQSLINNVRPFHELKNLSIKYIIDYKNSHFMIHNMNIPHQLVFQNEKWVIYHIK